MNHSSDKANIGQKLENGKWVNDWSYATRDIKIGEELLEDYGEFPETGWFLDIYKKYGINTSNEF